MLNFHMATDAETNEVFKQIGSFPVTGVSDVRDNMMDTWRGQGLMTSLTYAVVSRNGLFSLLLPIWASIARVFRIALAMFPEMIIFAVETDLSQPGAFHAAKNDSFFRRIEVFATLLALVRRVFVVIGATPMGAKLLSWITRDIRLVALLTQSRWIDLAGSVLTSPTAELGARPIVRCKFFSADDARTMMLSPIGSFLRIVVTLTTTILTSTIWIKKLCAAISTSLGFRSLIGIKTWLAAKLALLKARSEGDTTMLANIIKMLHLSPPMTGFRGCKLGATCSEVRLSGAHTLAPHKVYHELSVLSISATVSFGVRAT